MNPDNDAQIRQEAHRLWEEDGRPDGRDLEYWLRAEAELISQAPIAHMPPITQMAAPQPATDAKAKPAAKPRSPGKTPGKTKATAKV